MKIRTDFVTNSSSSSFVVEIDVISKDAKKVSMHLDINDDDFELNSKDGYKVARDFHINNKKNYASENINELIDLLSESVEIIDFCEEIDEEELEEEYDYDYYEYFVDHGDTVTVRDSLPNTLAVFKKQISEAELDLENISIIHVRRSEVGFGEGSTIINSSFFDEYIREYGEETKEGKEQVADRLVSVLCSEPEVAVTRFHDENYGTYKLFVEYDDLEVVRAFVTGILTGEIEVVEGTLSSDYYIDPKTGSVKTRKGIVVTL